ncbi:ribosome-associated protein [Tangfeifania diversioriginum]|uniref:Ribosomal silencing factor RsfS n=1 Tax=Tangfeifania diversioriginum TaxID=1168035 RepID=A0A1M6BD85_9BACT|nr:ribosome silencing factor [Tangfeifania diversioriginum]SHI46714.1 ribosome-associated protein [Tangfeifania diversioriginum]
MNKNEKITEKTKTAILEGIQKIKGKDITIIDLNTIHYTECGYFIICHGTSSTQVNSIARSVEETVKKETGEDAWHVEGMQNSIWVLLDFGEIVVHVFHQQARQFYNLEELWADAKFIKIDSEN